ncbi:MAG: DPP IV N-terminal domain-containing protein, partial [Actinomycetota bacterium]
MTESFPRQYARTQRFTLGEPRNITISPDGERIVFLRSSAGDDPVNSLWVKDLPSGDERLVADPTDDAPTDEERARRERLRDGSSGITSYATDDACQVAAFALDGRLHTAGLLTGHARHLPMHGPVFDPRPDPAARRLAYVCGRQLRIGELDGSSRPLAGHEGEPDTVSWGSAEFIAAEEMRRFRGFWWSPDGDRLAVCRVDTAPVAEWTIADPATPAAPARTMRYPAAGTDNADVTLWIIGLDGTRVQVEWDREFFPYLAHVEWTDAGLLLSCQSRDQQGTIVVRVDTDPAAVRHGIVEGEVVSSDYDDAWVEIVPGVPRLLSDGRLLTHTDEEGVRQLLVDDVPLTPDDIQVRSVAGTLPGPDGTDDEPLVVFLGNDPATPTEIHVYSVSLDGDVAPITTEPGVHGATVGSDRVVIRRAHLDTPGATFTVHEARGRRLHRTDRTIESFAERPVLEPNVRLLQVGERDLQVAVLFPTGFDPDTASSTERLPVLLDPYGGPHAQRVLANHDSMLASQWFADQGYCVLVCDGRGTPGRGAAWERAVRHDFVDPVLDDQVDAMRAVAEHLGCLDLRRVAIRGWSFGGFLAALAVLRRPEVFHVAIAGA